MEYRRIYINGGTYFFTLVSHNRKPIFSYQKTVEMLADAIHFTIMRMPFEIVASVILPDHIHMIWTMPEDACDFSTRWRLIKSHFTRAWCKEGTVSKSASRRKKGEQDVWQRRFWEHLVRDEADLTRHFEYIHYNPVKHGLVNSPSEWKYSSFTDYVLSGLYPMNWGENGNVWSGMENME
jgi:putative transposase